MKSQMEKSKPSEGTKKRLIRMLEGKYAVTMKQIKKFLRLSESQTKWYIAELKKENKIYVRYKQDRFNYYALRRNK
jgi:predicted ArsR family transcriptional regulator